MNELQARLGPLPLWGWLVAGVGLGGLALLFWRRKGGTSGATLGQSQQSSAQPNYNYSPIDPLTGVPYSVESQINPNTGQPNYYNQPPSPPTPTPAPQPSPIPPPTPEPIEGPPPGWQPPRPAPFPGGGIGLPPKVPGGFQQPWAATAATPPPYPRPTVGWPNAAGYR